MNAPDLKKKSKAQFSWEDPLFLDQQLSEDERMVRDAARDYCQGKLAPRVQEAFRHEKTDPAIFRAAHEAASCEPGQCFFTDDRADFVAAARGAGFQAETFRGARYLRAQLARRGVAV